jgi:hypothetical protein
MGDVQFEATDTPLGGFCPRSAEEPVDRFGSRHGPQQ